MNFISTYLIIMLATQPLFDFNKDADISNWYIVNDGVMGGVSNSTLSISQDGHGCFKGNISLDNNGGFASVRFDTGEIPINSNTHIVLKVKGDGNVYQIRLKENKSDFASYVQMIKTTGDWETIKLPLKDFKPRFRGRDVDRPNFSGTTLEEFGILFGNKQEESFEFLIDTLWLE